MELSKLAIGLASGIIMICALVACDSGSAADQAAPADAAAISPQVPASATTLKPTIAAQPQPAATQPAKPQPAVKSAATATKPAAVQSKPPTPTVTPSAASNSKKQGDDLEQQLDQLLNGLDHADTVDDAK